MKSLTESPAVLTVHEGSEGQYILRVSDLRHRPLVIQVTKLLEDARSFVIITPGDVKVFAVGDGFREPIGAEVPEPLETQDEEEHEIPQSVEEEPPKTRKRGRPAQIAGHDETCGRCQGKGRIQSILEGGAATDIACVICKGEGILRRYGARR